MRFILILILIGLIQNLAFSQSCNDMSGGCTNANCLNGTCLACDNGLDLSSNCLCQAGFYFDYNQVTDKCQPCNASCDKCYGPTNNMCLSCADKPGLVLNKVTNSCICEKGYILSENVEEPCTPCYTYGAVCFPQCPEETIANDKYMICEKEPTSDVENKDDTLYIFITIMLVVVILIITVVIYNFFAKLFQKVYIQKIGQPVPLCDEEKVYLEKFQTQQTQMKNNIEVKEVSENGEIEKENDKQQQEEDQTKLSILENQSKRNLVEIDGQKSELNDEEEKPKTPPKRIKRQRKATKKKFDKKGSVIVDLNNSNQADPEAKIQESVQAMQEIVQQNLQQNQVQEEPIINEQQEIQQEQNQEEDQQQERQERKSPLKAKKRRTTKKLKRKTTVKVKEEGEKQNDEDLIQFE